jgi:hypothetical protein
MEIIMKTITLSIILALTTSQAALAHSASDVFPGKEDGMVMKGEYVRKGTIKASFDNAVNLSNLMNQTGSEGKIRAIIKDQMPLGRGLYVLDVFELQPLEGWLSDPKRPGKILVAVLTLQVCPELMTDQIRSTLQTLIKNIHPILKAEIGKVLNESLFR